MAETQSPNYKWIKPDIGGDASTWGNVLNTTIDAVDSVVYANQQAGVPIGSIIMFGGPQSKQPAGWLLCAGQSLNTTTYASLFAVIGYMFGGSGANFSLPNLVGIFPMGMTNGEVVGQVGGEATHTLAAAEMPPHAHGVNDPTHAHGAYQNAHNHTIVTGGHSHGITTGGHSHTVSIPGSFGYLTGTANIGINPFVNSGSSTYGTSGVGNLGGNTDAAGNLGGYTDTQQPGVGIYGAGTGISIQNAGSGAAHNNLPPYLQLNFIIRCT